MDFNPRPELPNPSPDLENLQPDHIELRPGPGSSLEMVPPQDLSQDIGHRVQEEPELIGLEAMARGPIGVKMGLVVFDHEFHRSSVAVEFFVDDPRGQCREIRHHETRVRPEGVVLGLDDDPLVLGPAFGSIGELTELPDRGSLLPEAPVGRLDQRGGTFAQDRIRRQSQEIFQILGPRPALIDVDRKITVLVIEGVEEGHLLMPVDRVCGVVDVEEDRDRRRPVGVDERIDQDFGDPVKVSPGDGVFQPGERRLAGQGFVGGKTFAGHLQSRIVAQRVGVVGIFIAAGDLEDALGEHLADGMAGIAGMAAIADDLGDPADETQTAFDFPKEKNAGVGGDLAAVEIGHDLFSLDVFKKEGVRCYNCSRLFPPSFCCKRNVYQYVMRGNSFFYELLRLKTLPYSTLYPLPKSRLTLTTFSIKFFISLSAYFSSLASSSQRTTCPDSTALSGIIATSSTIATCPM